MDIKESICPSCGRPSPGGKLCGSCRAERTVWLECEPRVKIVFCPSCEARKDQGVWTDMPASRDEVAMERVYQAIKVSPDLKEQRIDIVLSDQSPNRTYADCTVTGTLYGVGVEGQCRIEIAWNKEQCDRCNRLSGSYYEGIVQVRATDRKPYPFEIAAAARIAEEMEETLQEGGERLSFISKMTDSRDGLDITVGSQKIGQEISNAIVARLGGRWSTHPKLVGEKAGRQIFRITYSVRLPRFVRGDVIAMGKRYGEVQQTEGHNIRYFDLSSGSTKTTKEDGNIRLVGNARDAESHMVVYREADLIGILDPVTGITRECLVGPFRDLAPGDTVNLLRSGEEIIVLGKA
jgi:nonsense-mediated mRNA decay protein 3